MIELLSFDLDDTLWDAAPVLERAERASYDWIRENAPRVAARYGIREMQQLRRELARRHPAIGHDFTRLRTAALAILLEEQGYDSALAVPAISLFVDVRSRVSLFPEVAAALVDLRRDFRLVALTNGNADLERAGVAQFFEFAISPADTGALKPDPLMLETVIEQAGVDAAAIVHIGDEPTTDIQAAHNAGVMSVWINRNQSSWPAAYRPANAEISSLDHLRGAIEKISAQLISDQEQA